MFFHSLKSQLDKFPPADDPTYDFAPDVFLRDRKRRPDQEKLRRLADEADPCLAFNALFTLLTLLWAQRKYQSFRQLVMEYQDRFGSDPRYPALMAQAYRRSNRPEELETGLTYADQALKANPDSPKALHTFAAIVTSLADHDQAEPELLERAEKAIDRAMNINPTYTWYSATLARILIHQHRYAEAKGIINQELAEINEDQPGYTLLAVTYNNLYQQALLSEKWEQSLQALQTPQPPIVIEE